jgi:hypothetical protein
VHEGFSSLLPFSEYSHEVVVPCAALRWWTNRDGEHSNGRGMWRLLQNLST